MLLNRILLLISIAATTSLNAQTLSLQALHSFGQNGYGPVSLIGLGNELCFAADDGITGYELWQYDSAQGVTQVVDLNQNGPSILPEDYGRMAVLNNKLYFCAADGITGYNVHEYDGKNLPELAHGFSANPSASIPVCLTAMGNRLYYTAYASGGNRLHRYDGVNPPVLIDSNRTMGNPNVGLLFPFNGKLIMTGQTSALGIELYSYDPVSDSITLIEDINPGKGVSNPGSFAEFNGHLYFSAIGTKGRELYDYDGNSVTRLTDLAPGTLSGLSSWEHTIAELNGIIYFAGTEDGYQKQLYSYNPATKATQQVAAPNGSNDANPEGLTRFKDHIYFSASTFATGKELWRTDGINTSMVYDLNPGKATGNPAQFYVWKNRLYFTMLDDGRGYTLLRLNDPTSVESVAFDGEVKAYPNPALNKATIEVLLNRPQAFRLNLADMTGSAVWQSRVASYGSGKHIIEIPTAAIVPGVYTYSVIDAGGKILAAGKLVRQ